MASRKIEDLREPFRSKVVEFQKKCDVNGLDVLIHCTLRTMEEQHALYAQGRWTKGKIVTYAMAGNSAHNYGLAIDVCPMLNGKPVWNPRDPSYAKMAAIGKSLGMEWSGDWKRFKEYVHFQEPNWKLLAKANV